MGTRHTPDRQTHWSIYRPDIGSASALGTKGLKEIWATSVAQRDTCRTRDPHGGSRMIPEGLSKGRRRRERKDTETKKEESGGGERRGRR